MYPILTLRMSAYPSSNLSTYQQHDGSSSPARCTPDLSAGICSSRSSASHN
ncbi:hypothetical protein BofuT4_uP096020.1 [Botrytis cinerea T4]|uniref:Uncharacterized protein n=1 Tax=Botryotinia fuckeliana (strain T4) TaxID=999810 RepID=G2YDP6_BOTF4|nr:hypothetical protein BofuT4_uP096020.1 [Botrytis cinerea T4]